MSGFRREVDENFSTQSARRDWLIVPKRR